MVSSTLMAIASQKSLGLLDIFSSSVINSIHVQWDITDMPVLCTLNCNTFPAHLNSSNEVNDGMATQTSVQPANPATNFSRMIF